VIHQFKVLANI